MHELSIAESILTIVKKEVSQGDYRGVTRIHVKVGALTALIPECLTTAFEAVSRGTIAENAVLEIEEVEARGTCRACGTVFVADTLLGLCPSCGSTDVAVAGGDDLTVDSMEVEQ